MSVTKLTCLYCDGKDCPLDGEPTAVAPRASDDAASLRRSAEHAGWLVGQRGGRDFCESCRDQVKFPTGK